MRIIARYTIIVIVCLGFLQLPVFAASHSAGDGPNLLVNGGMEGKYVMQCSARNGPPWVGVPCGAPIDFGTTFLWQTTQVPLGWTAWWQPPNTDRNDPNFYTGFPSLCYAEDAPAGCAAWHNPEYRDTAGGPQTPPSRKVAGDNSQKYFTFYSLHEAGLHQTVWGLKPGQRVRFSVYMEAWSSQSNDPFTSFGQPTMGLKVGIDPYGGNNPWSPSIVWSPVIEAFDHWELFTVEAVVKSDHVTVFTRSRPYFALQHNDVYVDEASLAVVSGSTQRVSERGSVTPKATETPGQFSINGDVRVGGTGGQRLILRSVPGANAKEVTRVPEGTRLTLVEGPRTVEGAVWWKVRNPEDGSEGWVAQRYLRAIGSVTPTVTTTLTSRMAGTPKTTATPRATATVKTTGTPRSTATLAPTATITLTPRATATVKTTGTPRSTATPAPTAAARQPIASAPDEYVVQPGDTLVSIAKKFGLLSADLLALNPQVKPPRYYVYPGQAIKIRP